MSAASRILVIFFALGIVLLGMKPLKRQYGGVFKSINEYTQEYFGKEVEMPKWKLPSEVSIELGGEKPKRKGPRLGVIKDDKEVQAFDKHTENDRSALDSLLKSLNK